MLLPHVNPRTLTAFFKKIRITEPPAYGEIIGPCWFWTGAVDSGNGGRYGKMKVDGKMVRAHRWAYEVFVGSIRVDEDAHHLCEHPQCVNPMHIQKVHVSKHSKRGMPVNAWDGVPI